MIFCHLLKVQLKQCLTWKVFVAAVLFAAMQAFGIAGMILGGEITVWYIAIISLSSGMGYLTLLLLPTLPFSMSLSQEWLSRASVYWITRMGIWRYALAKLLMSAVSGFLVTAFGMMIFCGGASLFMPGYLFTGNVSNSYEMFFFQGAPVLGWVCLVIHYGLSGALVAMFGMFLTLFVFNPFVAVSAPISFFLLLTRLLNGIGIDTQSIWWPASWVMSIHNAPTPGQTLTEKAVLVCCLCALMCLVGMFQLKRRMEYA